MSNETTWGDGYARGYQDGLHKSAHDALVSAINPNCASCGARLALAVSTSSDPTPRCSHCGAIRRALAGEAVPKVYGDGTATEYMMGIDWYASYVGATQRADAAERECKEWEAKLRKEHDYAGTLIADLVEARNGLAQSEADIATERGARQAADNQTKTWWEKCEAAEAERDRLRSLAFDRGQQVDGYRATADIAERECAKLREQLQSEMSWRESALKDCAKLREDLAGMTNQRDMIRRDNDSLRSELARVKAAQRASGDLIANQDYICRGQHAKVKLENGSEYCERCFGTFTNCESIGDTMRLAAHDIRSKANARATALEAELATERKNTIARETNILNARDEAREHADQLRQIIVGLESDFTAIKANMKERDDALVEVAELFRSIVKTSGPEIEAWLASRASAKSSPGAEGAE